MHLPQLSPPTTLRAMDGSLSDSANGSRFVGLLCLPLYAAVVCLRGWIPSVVFFLLYWAAFAYICSLAATSPRRRCYVRGLLSDIRSRALRVAVTSDGSLPDCLVLAFLVMHLVPFLYLASPVLSLCVALASLAVAMMHFPDRRAPNEADLALDSLQHFLRSSSEMVLPIVILLSCLFLESLWLDMILLGTAAAMIRHFQDRASDEANVMFILFLLARAVLPSLWFDLFLLAAVIIYIVIINHEAANLAQMISSLQSGVDLFLVRSNIPSEVFLLIFILFLYVVLGSLWFNLFIVFVTCADNGLGLVENLHQLKNWLSGCPPRDGDGSDMDFTGCDDEEEEEEEGASDIHDETGEEEEEESSEEDSTDDEESLEEYSSTDHDEESLEEYTTDDDEESLEEYTTDDDDDEGLEEYSTSDDDSQEDDSTDDEDEDSTQTEEKGDGRVNHETDEVDGFMWVVSKEYISLSFS